MTFQTFVDKGIQQVREQGRLALNKILVPTDFSRGSAKAFAYALELAQQFGAELTLIHVIKPAASPSFPDLPGASAFCEQELKRAEEELRHLVKGARAAVVNATSTFQVGLAAHEIVEQSSKETNA